ncbi:hypothetical protein FWK35_00019907 [Aphis craccivora]|uniref:Uncharacterized protein n=1 Tax=Aphis craccivora TaxID=307492 RepID=A0A6G0VVW2_APHCR|nr:hypothetical protein FWK35_00019907 [Aphis craccivora]
MLLIYFIILYYFNLFNLIIIFYNFILLYYFILNILLFYFNFFFILFYLSIPCMWFQPVKRLYPSMWLKQCFLYQVCS